MGWIYFKGETFPFPLHSRNCSELSQEFNANLDGLLKGSFVDIRSFASLRSGVAQGDVSFLVLR